MRGGYGPDLPSASAHSWRDSCVLSARPLVVLYFYSAITPCPMIQSGPGPMHVRTCTHAPGSARGEAEGVRAF